MRRLKMGDMLTPTSVHARRSHDCANDPSRDRQGVGRAAPPKRADAMLPFSVTGGMLTPKGEHVEAVATTRQRAPNRRHHDFPCLPCWASMPPGNR